MPTQLGIYIKLVDEWDELHIEFYKYFTTCTSMSLQIGLIGLVEYEWLATLSTISPEDVDYTDFVDCAQLLVPQLTAEVHFVAND